MDNEVSPWTILSKQVVYDNPWVRVEDHQVLTPAGKPGIYGTVHFKNLAIGVVPIDRDGCVPLVGQYRFPLATYSWELPEGGGARDVAPLDSAQRELREETGLTAAHWRPIVEMDTSNSVTDERAFLFLAWDLSPGPTAPDETEQLQVRHVPFWTVVAMIESGEIRDSLTVVGILRVVLMVVRHQLPPTVATAIGTPPPPR
ncbi:MAG: NUDIX hydrolase [Azospirillaceae bacterium]|nr:NUDIX hydrolase [Azospirillaceae bacterium]